MAAVNARYAPLPGDRVLGRGCPQLLETAYVGTSALKLPRARSTRSSGLQNECSFCLSPLSEAPSVGSIEMPKLKPSTQAARREHILDAAERCFARSGFHRTTMQDICREAQVSPGALYLYFASKEELIAGISERERSHLAQQLTELGKADDLIAALRRIAEHYSIEEPRHKRVLCMEIAAESTRNPAVGEIFRSVDRYVIQSFEQLFAEARKAGRIDPAFDPALLAQLIVLIGDGLFWRRAVDPDYDAEAMLPALIQLVSTLINPVPEGISKVQAASDPGASRCDNVNTHRTR